MPGRTTRIDLTAGQQRQLQGWVRAGTTAQRMARRARLILGSAAGSRRLAQHEGLSRTTARRGRAICIRPVTRALTVVGWLDHVR